MAVETELKGRIEEIYTKLLQLLCNGHESFFQIGGLFDFVEAVTVCRVVYIFSILTILKLSKMCSKLSYNSIVSKHIYTIFMLSMLLLS